MAATAAIRAFDTPFKVLWDRDDCSKFEKLGILNYKYQLIEGEIYRVGQNFPHIDCIMELISWMILTFGNNFVESQAPIDLRPEDSPLNMPEPDGIVLNRSRKGLNRLAKPEDIALLIEVSDTTLAFDLGIKASLYARSEIPEYWVIDLNDRAIFVHREPAEGVYKSVVCVREPNSVSPLSKPGVSTLVSTFLPNINI